MKLITIYESLQGMQAEAGKQLDDFKVRSKMEMSWKEIRMKKIDNLGGGGKEHTGPPTVRLM